MTSGKRSFWNRRPMGSTWAQPMVQLRLPLLFNLRADPFERAQQESGAHVRPTGRSFPPPRQPKESGGSETEEPDRGPVKGDVRPGSRRCGVSVTTTDSR